MTPDASELSFKVTGTTMSPVTAGEQAVLEDQAWEVTVPASVLQTGINLGLLSAGDSLPVEVTAAVFASNTKEGTRTAAPEAFTAGPIEVSSGAAQPLTTGFAVDDMTWTAVGGDVGFSMAETVMNVAVGPLEVVFTCEPKDPGLTIVQATVIGKTNIPPAGRDEDDEDDDGTEVKGETVTSKGGALPRTGWNPWVGMALGIGLIDLGYLLASAVRPARRRWQYLQH